MVMMAKNLDVIREPRRTCDTCTHSLFVCDTRHRCQAYGKIVTSSDTCESWVPMPLWVDKPRDEREHDTRWVAEVFGAMSTPRLQN